MLSNLLSSFTSQVIPPTAVKRLQVINLLRLFRNISVTVCQAPQMNTPKYQLVAPPSPSSKPLPVFLSVVNPVTTTPWYQV